MALNIDTFSNLTGGQSFFKAVGHPLAAEKVEALINELKNSGPVSIYDPQGFFEAFAALYDFSKINCEGIYVQKYEALDREILGHKTKPITQIKNPKTLLLITFDANKYLTHIKHLLPSDTKALSLDNIRIPEELLTNPKNYLDPLNFTTNLVFFRDQAGHHTRLVTANYWTAYSGKPCKLWMRLFDENGRVLHTWMQDLIHAGGTVVLDSKEVRAQFKLGEFCGQIFFQVVGAAGHDIIKYALDCYNDDGTTLTCTHDANSWPADFYAGLPAPHESEQVLLWVQNSHPTPIPAKAIGANVMGDSGVVWCDKEVPPFGSFALNVNELLPKAKWPQQIEVHAGKHFVRPRYEVVTDKSLRIAHMNVERTDLKTDPKLKELKSLYGKGFILPAPVLPTSNWQTIALPTPMARSQQSLAITLILYNAKGEELGRHNFGNMPRDDMKVLNINEWMQKSAISLGGSFGHIEMIYDFDSGDDADGWLHGLFRYKHNDTNHEAETSFGAHIFNTALTYKTQPHSYRGTPPGLSTKLFLRLGNENLDAFCHLIYPASTPWHANSSTELLLHSKEGEFKAKADISIPCSGSLFWKASEVFSKDEILKAGKDAYIIIRDTTCRLFGYHGLLDANGRFSLDHMFGF